MKKLIKGKYIFMIVCKYVCVIYMAFVLLNIWEVFFFRILKRGAKKREIVQKKTLMVECFNLCFYFKEKKRGFRIKKEEETLTKKHNELIMDH